MHAAAISPRGGVAPETTRFRGQSIIEYVLIAAIIGLVIVFAGPQVSGAIRNQFNQVSNTVDSGTDGGNFMSAEEKAYQEVMKTVVNKDAKNYRCRYYMQTSHGAYDYWSGRHTVTGSRFVFVGESQDATVAAGCFRATKHAIETCFKKFCGKRFEQNGTKIGRRAGVKNSYCLGFIQGLENSYREQLEQDETMALAIVVPESVNRYMNDELNCKKMKPRPITVSSDHSIEDAGRQDGYGFGQGDRIASCA